MVRGSLYIFFRRRHTNGQKALEKILNITHHREMQIKTKMRCHLIPLGGLYHKIENTVVTRIRRN